MKKDKKEIAEYLWLEINKAIVNSSSVKDCFHFIIKSYKLGILMEDKFQVLHMCDFCSKEIETCEASPRRARELKVETDQLANPSAVVACVKYESPLEVLKKRFH